ncbi:hypothetical protein IFR05_003052 [Cadophora sp. M221]|nr:hypothetical protein IFR05_003052 [Cadophora sp. M221]
MASNELTGAFSTLKLSTAPPTSEDDFLVSFNKLQISGPAQRALPDHPLIIASRELNRSRKRLPTAPAFEERRAWSSMNWATGQNSMRPLEGYIQYPPPPPPARPYKPKYSVENPSPYYLDQIAFYCAPTISDPFQRQAEEPSPKTQFETIILAILNFLSLTKSSLCSGVVTAFSLIFAIISFIYQRGIADPLEGVQHILANITLYGIGAFLVAAYLATILPSWRGAAVEVIEESEPLYRIFISGREALGNGPVTPGSL